MAGARGGVSHGESVCGRHLMVLVETVWHWAAAAAAAAAALGRGNGGREAKLERM